MYFTSTVSVNISTTEMHLSHTAGTACVERVNVSAVANNSGQRGAGEKDGARDALAGRHGTRGQMFLQMNSR